MPDRMQVYKCELCGNIVEVLHGGGSDLVCCGENMTYLEENTVDAAKEKHVPVIEKIEGGFRVTVGSVPHPMEEKHFIEWIEVITDDDRVFRKFLSPGMAAEGIFTIDADSIIAREYCNLHGLWKSEGE